MLLQDSAKAIINTSLGVKKGEKVLIIIDTTAEKIGKALFETAKESKVEVMITEIVPRKAHGEEPPEPIAEMMRYADVIIIATQFSLTHTKARKLATRAGARIVAVPGATEEMFLSGAITPDFKEVEKNIRKTHTAVRSCKELVLKTDLGTDLSMSVKNRKWITEDIGICRERCKLINLPPGEIFIAPNEGTANGYLIVDWFFNSKLDKPIEVTLKEGIVEKISDKGLEKLLSRKDKFSRAVGEFGLGMNPSARLVGNILEDVKVLGTAHIGFGDNYAIGGTIKCEQLITAVVTSPTVTADGEIIIDRGKLAI